jgi:hypothetical protein
MQDRLAPLLARFHLSASVFHSGALCGYASYDESEGVGHLHLVDRGSFFLASRAGGELESLPVPALVLFPKPTSHRLFVPDDDEATLLCATVRFGGGTSDPISRSLPSPLVIDLTAAPALHGIARLLFEEAFGGQCGRQQALEDRPDVKVIFVSGYAEDALSEMQARIPNSVFLPKPFSLSDLAATVQGQLLH